MAKQTKRQIIENTRKKIAGQYAEQVRDLKEKNKAYWHKQLELQGEISKLKHEKSELEMKVKEQEDWIERLIHFVNLPPDQREQEVALLRQQQANAAAEKRLFESPLFKMYEKYFAALF